MGKRKRRSRIEKADGLERGYMLLREGLVKHTVKGYKKGEISSGEAKKVYEYLFLA